MYIKKLTALILSCIFILVCFTCCTNNSQQTADNSGSTVNNTTENDTSTDNASASEHTMVIVTVKDFGEFTIELYPEYAPETVASFLKLVNEGFYSGKEFHRIVDGFMAQGGASTGENVPTIKGEFANNGFTQNTLKHERGTISMARSNDMNSASSQFFICYENNYYVSNLDGNYAAFGKVIEGMETVDKFLTVERTVNSLGENATPVTPIVIEKAEVIK